MTMTQNNGAGLDWGKNGMNWRNLDKACKLAQQNGVSTALITGKGEPTLYPGTLLGTAEVLTKYFPLVELQTNGYKLGTTYLEELYKKGLTTVIVSMVHYDNNKNNEIYNFPKPQILEFLIKNIHDAGLSVRLSCIMLKGYIDSVEEVDKLISFAKEHRVEQLTIRPVEVPELSKSERVYHWTLKNMVESSRLDQIHLYYDKRKKLLMNLVHGAKVYDCGGQNLCISNCLTSDPNPENIRQLIYFPDGHLYYDWAYPGAILL
jgi:molybdenum cofactor biosynthesis enzyme MoaA